MSDLIGDTRYDVISFYVSDKTGRFHRVNKSLIVGQHMRRAVADTVANNSLKRLQVLVIEDGCYSFALSRISAESIDLLQNLTQENYNELFSGVESMRLNGLLSLENLVGHARRTWPAVPRALRARA